MIRKYKSNMFHNMWMLKSPNPVIEFLILYLSTSSTTTVESIKLICYWSRQYSDKSYLRKANGEHK